MIRGTSRFCSGLLDRLTSMKTAEECVAVLLARDPAAHAPWMTCLAWLSL